MNNSPPLHSDRARVDAEMTLEVFRKVAAIAHREAGLVLSETKIAMVKSRLTRRLRILKMRSFEQYLEFVEADKMGTEMDALISALTTNVSHFFRESHHFDTLRQKTLPELLEKAKKGGSVRIWSAGCSNGQEPYSIAMTLLELDPQAHQKDIRILATDIDPEVLKTATAGVYGGSLTSGISEAMQQKYFDTTVQSGEPAIVAKQTIKEMITFRKLNLHSEWPMKKKIDVIFCRNVLIYFDEPTQASLYQRFLNVLSPDGWLFLGHSERMDDVSARSFVSNGVTTYRKMSSGPAHETLSNSRKLAQGA